MRQGIFGYFIVCFFLIPVITMAHGINHKPLKGGLGIEATYLDGSAMADCDVEIFSPEDKDTPFQTAQADKNGRIVFFPDKAGTWKVNVDDGMGHRLETTIKVDKEMNADETDKGQLQQWQKILMVLCLIFGLTGVYYYYLANKKIKAMHDPAE
jgi:nickel transport protein